MSADGQSDLIAFLAAPASNGLAGPIEVIETHISRIFLAGDRAFKTKLDFSQCQRPARRASLQRRKSQTGFVDHGRDCRSSGLWDVWWSLGPSDATDDRRSRAN